MNRAPTQEQIERWQKLGIKCTSLYASTDENYERDEDKVYFHFVDYPNQKRYSGAFLYTELFELLKPRLKVEESE